MNWREKLRNWWKRFKRWGRHKLRIFILAWILIPGPHPLPEYEDTINIGIDSINVAGDDTPFSWPVKKFRITSYYGPRSHPIFRFSDFHKGIDLDNEFGTPIYAAGDGKVIKAGWHNKRLGNAVIIEHKNGYKTYYGHMTRRHMIREGVEIKRGQMIGRMGSSGSSTGSHLHFAIYRNNKSINPVTLLPHPRGKLFK